MAESKQVKVPNIGDFENVDIIEVLIAPGDRVAKEQSLIVLESEKASMEVPSPYAGVVREVKVSVGDRVSEGSLICTMDVTGGAEETEPVSKKTVERPAPQAPKSSAPEATAVSKPKPEPSAAPSEEGAEAPKKKIPHAPPSVRRRARELGVDLAHVPGSGPKGRITKDDVRKYVRHAMSLAGTATGTGFALPTEMPHVDFSKYGEIRVQPLTKIQKISGKNLHRSWIGIPHVTQHDEADITELEAFRKKMKEKMKNGVKLTMLGFLMKALAVVLKEMPKFNSSLDPSGENLILKEYFHIGIAVDTPNGLVVPVIRDVNFKGLVDLAKELAEVSERARARRLSPGDLQGGCISISNLGGLGGSFFTPIINPPEVAVLGVSKALVKPVWTGKEFEPRLLCPLSLSYDHRVIDGADAARFITRLAEVLANPVELAL